MKWVKHDESSYDLIDDDGRVYIWLDELNGSWSYFPKGLFVECYEDQDLIERNPYGFILNTSDEPMNMSEAILSLKKDLAPFCKEMADFYLKFVDSIPKG